MEQPQPPRFLLLGSDALAGHRQMAQARIGEVDRWEKPSASTDYIDE
ncbi:hypothetical protein [Mycolicibacterium chubuense]|nr:hypothetical protein [Mycolicibacterium chubuense]